MAKHLQHVFQYKPTQLAVGTLLSAALAVLVSMLFAKSTWRGALPLAFVFVLILLSRRFGVGVSVLGSVSASIVFALMLFTPVGSPSIESPDARMNLGWMVLGAVAVSYLLFPSDHKGHHS